MRSFVSRYVVAVLLVAAALLFGVVVYSVVPRFQALLFLAAVVLTAWRVGLGPALVAAVLSALAVDYFFIPPLGTIELNEDHVVRLVTFLSVSIMIAWLNESLKRERARAEHQAAETRHELVERTRAEQNLRASEAIARLRHEEIVSIYRSAPIGLCVLDSQLRIVRCNQRFAGMTGSDEVEGRALRDVFPGLVPPQERLAGLLAGRESLLHLEVGIPTRRGQAAARTWLQTWSPLLDSDGRVSGINVVLQDVTESREVERQLREAGRLKDEFLSTLSHELRTPLNAILGWSQMLMDGRLSADATQRAVRAINRAAHAQTALVNDILDLSRINAGKMLIRHEPLDVAGVVQHAIDTLKVAAEAKSIRVRAQLDCRATVSGDPDRLQQVFWNLLSNAIKFTPAGGEVTVEGVETDAGVEVRVRDTGVGIGAHFLPHVFEAFTQAESSAAREHGGLGLGLAIVKRLVEMHEGTVKAESAPGAGSLFTVRLPRAASGRSARAAHSPSAAPAEVGPLLSGLCLLVVDDDPESRHLLETVLTQQGARVVTAADADSALLALGRDRFDLLISDVAMPRVDGYELIRRVRTLPGSGGRVPAIAVTAHGRKEDRGRALAAGYQQHVCKPIVPHDIVALVAATIGRGEQSAIDV